MPSNRLTSRPFQRAWRTFSAHDGRHIERQLRRGLAPCCPCCGDVLEARPGSRLSRDLPLDARGYDLDCRECRRFWCIVLHTQRSLQLVRMRRLAAAIRAVKPEPATRTAPASAAVA